MKPMLRNCRNGLFLLVTLACLGPVSGCATVQSWWPWHSAPPAAPQPVRELNVSVPADMAMPVVLQFWERNTLVMDLQQVPPSGQIMLTRDGDKPWPARMAFRMSPSRFETLQVRGAQRVVLPLSTGDGGIVQAELPASAYDKDTRSLQVSWGTRDSF
jgi:hypothetical protein